MPFSQAIPTPPGAEKLSLVLKDIKLSGNTIFTTDELAELYTPYLGKKITLADVYGIAAAITQKYEAAGYLLTVATLPEQEIKDGIVKIQVVEAHLTDLKITGQNLSPKLVEKFRARTQTLGPLHRNDLQEILLLLGSLPGAVVTPVLMPGSTTGAVMLDIAMNIKPYNLNVGLNNRSSRYTGAFRQNASITLNNLPQFSSLKLAEETAFPASELRILDLNYTLPLDAYGNMLELGATTSHSEPGFTLKQYDVKSESDNFRLRWQTPLWLTTDDTARLQFTFEHTNASSTLLGAPNSDDKLRVLEAALLLNKQHADGSNTASRIAVRQGLGLMGASDRDDAYLSRANGRSEFTSLKFDLQHYQPLTPNWSLTGSLTGQYAGAQLLASEEFAWGGSTFGRGYDTAELTGDHGVGANLEATYTLLPTSYSAPLHQFYGFTDFGTAWRIDNNQPDTRTSGLSAGLGWRTQWGSQLFTNLEVAKPLTRPNSNMALDGNRPRLFFNLQWRH